MESTSITAHEIGRLYYERGDMLKAVAVLETEAARLLSIEQDDQFLEVVHLLFRCHAELLNFEKIEFYKSLLLERVGKEGITVTGKTYYILALCASYKNEHDLAIEYCQKSLTLSLAQENKETVCYAILGLAISYYSLDRLDDAFKEIYNLQVFMNVLPLPEIRISMQLLKAHIYRKMKKYDAAVEMLWDGYALLKEQKNFHISLSLLYGMALAYKEAGQLSEARNYVKLVQQSIDKNNLRRLGTFVEVLAKEIGAGEEPRYDIIFDDSDHSVVEKGKGRIDFNNQFILIDLLKLFLTHPGQSFSKEQLVKLIWKQSYNPDVHDNKIYVTIKRLRQLIEPDIEKPKYIFRSKSGYYFNKESSVVVKEQMRERL